MYTVRCEDHRSREVQTLLVELSAVLANITGSSGEGSFALDDLDVERAIFAVARDGAGRAVGCGAIRPISQSVGEVKRMYARPTTRGVGSAILGYLEERARASGYTKLILETRKVNQRAVCFYRNRNYQQIENYGKYVDNPLAVCFAKRLD